MSLPEIEQSVLNFWQKEDIFAKTVAARRDAEPFVFYDGPPFTTGSPHYGHIMQMAFKDVVLRYKTMQQYKVPRKIGWDTHGLPVEYQLEKELGLQGGKKAIEEYGIDKFVEAARKIVLRAVDEWDSTMTRMGRWVDTSHPYTTMDNNYIESVWWAFKSLYDKGLVYKDFRVSPYCPRCGTVLSNFELNQGYQDNVPDISIYTKLKVTSDGKFKDSHLIFWTTTPWSTFGVVAMSVNVEADYVLFEVEGEKYVMAEARVGDLFKDFEILDKFKGSELVGLTYEPLYKVTDQPNLHRVVSGEHVTTEDGTGIASIAPAYGEIDAEVGKQENLPMVQTVEPDGSVKKGWNFPGEGQFVKDAEKGIVADLEQRGLLVEAREIRHTYPFCWRCGTPLLYFPVTSWYVKVTDFKDKLVAANKKIQWQPEHLRDGRFGKWLEGARDWAVSRSRYWGAPLPIWECDKCDTIKVVEKRQDLNLDESFDLHRPYIDDVTLPCEKCEGIMKRVPFVFDCWFESGSMPYAQWHYPFANHDQFEPKEGRGYPADFIGEALDQTRGWFYTLHVLGVGLFDEAAYKSVVVSGLILAPDGRKLSKSLRNYVDPELLFNEEGADALRLFLLTSASLGEDYRFSDAMVRDVKRRWLVPLLNVLTYYSLSQNEADEHESTEPTHALLDTWFGTRLTETRHQIEAAMNGDAKHSPYDLVRACRTFGPLIEDLSTWYVRLSRGRKDPAFVKTLGDSLIEISKMFAPFLPFVTEHIYQYVRSNTDPQSVHMTEVSRQVEMLSDEQKSALHQMEIVRHIVTAGREIRAKQGIPVRQPLGLLQVVLNQSAKTALTESGKALIAQELQIKQVEVVDVLQENLSLGETNAVIKQVGVDTTLTPELENEGLANTLRRTIQDLRKQAGLQPGDKAEAFVSPLDEKVKELIQEQLITTKVTNESLSDDSVRATDVTWNSHTIHVALKNV